jgi:hypothetical protein
VLDSKLTIPQWGMAMDARKQREVFCLHHEVYTVEEALLAFSNKLQKMPTHVFKMTNQWEALARAKQNLQPFELITEEDFQVFIMCSVQFTVCSLQCAVCSVQCAVCSV